MKTKEITGKVSGWKQGEIFVKLDDQDNLGIASIGDKVTIHHLIPEKKAEITESDFHQMTRDFEDPKNTSAFRNWYVKLFGEEK